MAGQPFPAAAKTQYMEQRYRIGKSLYPIYVHLKIAIYSLQDVLDHALYGTRYNRQIYLKLHI
jgi:hypothetical protein